MNAETAPTTAPGPSDAAGRPPVRAATFADAGAITRMRSAYVLSAPLTDDWLRLCTDELAPRLTPQGDARTFVVDAPDGTLAASALGLISHVLPAPAYPRGRAARVQIAATRPEFRRRGYARAVVTALLDHLADVEDVTLFELHTSPEATPLYRELGFNGNPALMRMTRHRPPADTGAAARAQPVTTWVPPQVYADSLHRAAAYVCLYITDENDRPLQLHSVYSPGHPWHMIGGAMDLGERPWDTVVRECREETGMRAVGPPRLLATVFGVPRAQRPTALGVGHLEQAAELGGGGVVLGGGYGLPAAGNGGVTVGCTVGGRVRLDSSGPEGQDQRGLLTRGPAGDGGAGRARPTPVSRRSRPKRSRRSTPRTAAAAPAPWTRSASRT
ncbi:GCN5-related N-acetyltransferase [Streptomyces sp. ACT-1]|nr:GCN5-related N-acetyltransferase [Streptomyces sp. ACT-1]